MVYIDEKFPDHSNGDVMAIQIYCDMVVLDSLNSVVLDMILAKLQPCLHSTVPTGRAHPSEEAS